MKRIYKQEINNNEYEWYIDYDKTFYVKKTIEANGKVVEQLFGRLKDIPKYYIKNEKILFYLVNIKATDTLDIMKVDKGKFLIDVHLNSELYMIMEASKNGIF